MFEWILIGVLYVAGIAFFRFIGGLDSASDGLRRWGASYAERQRNRNRLPSAFTSPQGRRDARQ